MSNEIVYLQGPIMFAKVFEGNRDRGMFAPEGGQYTIDIGLKGSDIKTVKGWNRRYLEKAYKAPYDEGIVDGYDYFQFKRKHVNKNNSKYGGPPKVLDKDGDFWDLDTSGLIGNGSICTVKLSVYRGSTVKDGKKVEYTSVTIEAVRVEEHIPYSKNDDNDEEVEDTPKTSSGVPF